MIPLESSDDRARGKVTYELGGVKRIQLDARDVYTYGAATLIRELGYEHLLPTKRVRVVQDGRFIGTLPPDFDLAFIKSSSYFYQPRLGDFRYVDGVLVADRMLGPADLEAVSGFVWEDR